MEKHCTMVNFSIRETKMTNDDKAPIEISISSNGKRLYFNSGKKINPNEWNRSKQAAKGKSDEAILLNSYLTQVRNKIFQKELELMQRGFIVTPQLLKDACLDKVETLNEKSLLEILMVHNQERKAMVGKTLAPATYWVFEYSARLFKEYINQKYQRKDLYLRELNISFIQGFHSFLLRNE